MEDLELPPELQPLLEQAAQGDRSCLPALRKAFKAHPELVAHFGSLAKHAELSLIRLAAGESLLASEAMHADLAALRERLLATAKTELERLLVLRVCLAWLHVSFADVVYTGIAKDLLSPITHAAMVRLESAERRFQAAAKSLALVQKLRPGRTILDVVGKPAKSTGAPGQPTNRISDLVGVG